MILATGFWVLVLVVFLEIHVFYVRIYVYMI